MNVLDLFSGVGGFSLGLERAGMRTVAFCEIEPYCRAVLAKRWPGVPCHPDIRELTADRLGERVDLICGGFPCQDISLAGDGAGLAGSRSGLWREFRRLIEEIRPPWTVIENVSALRSRGLDQVLGELSALGMGARWDCIPACAVGAPHIRDRVWIVAHADTDRERFAQWAKCYGDALQSELEASQRSNAVGLRHDVADANAEGPSQRREQGVLVQRQAIVGDRWWLAEPNLGRVAHGVPARVDRIRCLGNAVIPQIPEIIGRAIMRCAL